MEERTKLAYVPPVPIQMFDHEDMDEEEPVPNEHLKDIATSNQKTKQPHPRHLTTWALNVHIGECTVVTGSNNQQFAVWNINIETSSNAHIHIFKRYSEFDKFRNQLIKIFPDHLNEIPKLPPKKYIGNLKNEFLNKRRRGLEYFLSCVLLNPVLANSKLVKQFVSPPNDSNTGDT